jgi:hypothetical protein
MGPGVLYGPLGSYGENWVVIGRADEERRKTSMMACPTREFPSRSDHSSVSTALWKVLAASSNRPRGPWPT